MSNTPPVRVRFGPFELDLKAGELHLADARILLQEQPYQLLRMLVERNGDVVTRQEIETELWSNDVVIEFDTGINQAIKKLRKALDDSADEPKYVETVGRRGYRLIVPVERAEIVSDDKEDPTSRRGKKISHYRVLEIIGGGGMGVVYKAEDLTLGRQVALKFLPEELATNPAAVDSFRFEARIASSLNHPNICTIYEFGEHEGHLFIVMELLEGQTLRGCLASGSLRGTGSGMQVARDHLFAVARQILDGLQAAHQQGIIHRDIKPVNLFITERGVAKLLDFGLAKLVESTKKEAIAENQAQNAGVSRGGSINSSAFSGFGIGAGTAAYMSPEQVRGERLDARTDLFSFGLVLYEMAVGRRAFSGETVEELRDAILSQPTPSVEELESDLLPMLGQIINKALVKDRERRYQSAAEFLTDLIQLERSLPSENSRPQEIGQRPSVSEAPRIKTQTRVLIAAVPSVRVVGDAIEVVVWVGREDQLECRHSRSKELSLRTPAIHFYERSFTLEHEVDDHRNQRPHDIIIHLDSPRFEPRTQTKKLRIPLGSDSVPCTFLITPQVAGELVANLELLNVKQQIIASRSIRTRAVLPENAGIEAGVSLTFSLLVELYEDLREQRRRPGVNSERPEVDRDLPNIEAPAIEQQKRFLEAGAPKEATVGRYIEVVAMVRREESGGLRAYLKTEGLSGPTSEDVQERPAEFEFVVIAKGPTQPAEISLRLESPNFEPRTQTKQLLVPPWGDSSPCTFLITPQVAGPLIANFELLDPGEQFVVSRALYIRAQAEGPATSSGFVVLTIPLTMIVHADDRVITVPFAPSAQNNPKSVGGPVPKNALVGPIAIGKTISNYLLLDLIGAGGMGVVYKAKDPIIGRFVVLKLLARGSGSDSKAFQRLKREACISSALKHPNICSVYDVGESDGQPFIVMEFLEGQTLRGCLASGTLRGAGPASQVAIDKLLDIAVQIADGLAAVHENGIIHGDLKPDNIFITKQGIVKILDFGLAQATRSIESDPVREHATLAATLPQVDPSLWASDFSQVQAGLMGTLSYMSPEQVRGDKLDERIDLFSFGLILYEMATGRRAFKGDLPLELMKSIGSQTPVPQVSSLNPDVPPELELIIMTAVQKPRELRYQSAAQMYTDLQIAWRRPT
jgi:serine/threonine protein kinase